MDNKSISNKVMNINNSLSTKEEKNNSLANELGNVWISENNKVIRLLSSIDNSLKGIDFKSPENKNTKPDTSEPTKPKNALFKKLFDGKSKKDIVKSALKITGIALAAASIWTYFKNIFNEVSGINKETGLVTSQTNAWRDTINDISTRQALIGASYSETARHLKEMYEYNGYITKNMKENAGIISTQSSQYGISAESLLKINGLLLNQGNVSKGLVDNEEVLNNIREKSIKNGMSYKSILEDTANISEDALTYLGSSPKAISDAVIEAKKLGMELDDMASVADSLLDIESSFTAQQEASVLLGRQINFNKARQLAFEGDIAGATKSVLDQVGSIDKFNKLNIMQQKKLAEASGLTVQQIRKQYEMRKKQAVAENSLGGTVNNIWEKFKNFGSWLAKSALLSPVIGMFNKISEVVEDLHLFGHKGKLATMMHYSKEELSEGSDGIMGIIKKIVLVVKIAKEKISKIFGSINEAISNTGKEMGDSPFITSMDSIMSNIQAFVEDDEKINNLINFFKNLGSMLMTVGKIIIGSIKFIVGAFSTLKKIFKNDITATVILIGGIITTIGLFKGVLNKLIGSFTKGVSTIFDSLSKVVSSAFKVIKSTLKGVGESIGAFAKSLAKNFTSMVKAGIGLAIIGGSIWVFAQAMKGFSGVSWKDVVFGTIALAALSGIAILIGYTAAPAMILGSIAIGILGASLWLLGKGLKSMGPSIIKVGNSIATVFGTIGKVANNFLSGIGDIIDSAFSGMIKLFNNMPDPKQILGLASSLYVLAPSLVALITTLTAGKFADTLGSFFGGEDIFTKLTNLGKQADKLGKLPKVFKAMESIKFSKIKEGLTSIVEPINNINGLDNMNKVVSEVKNTISGIFSKEDEKKNEKIKIDNGSTEDILGKILVAIEKLDLTIDGKKLGKVISNSIPSEVLG